MVPSAAVALYGVPELTADPIHCSTIVKQDTRAMRRDVCEKLRAFQAY